MNTNNIWAGFLALLLGIGFTIALYDMLNALISIADIEIRPIIAVPAIILLFTIGFLVPFTLLTEDDRGSGA